MPAHELFLFTNDNFGRPFWEAMAAECRSLGKRLTIVIADPVREPGAIRRQRTRTTRPIREIVERRRRGCRVWLAEDINADRFLRRLPQEPNGVITGYSQIFRAATIVRFATLVNLHPSLLPYYRGPAPVYWSVQNGERRSGYTLHEVTEVIDEGPVLRQQVIVIPADAAKATDAIVAAAVPAVRDWGRHILVGAEFDRSRVDADAVYRVRDGYRTAAEYWENERRLGRLTR